MLHSNKPTTVAAVFSLNLTIGNNMSDYKKYECEVCGHIYDEAEGDPDSDIAPGTRWEDVPEDWRCPDCRVGKEDFVLMA
jgi:rubredoxin-NAD+ reductase